MAPKEAILWECFLLRCRLLRQIAIFCQIGYNINIETEVCCADQVGITGGDCVKIYYT